MIRRVLLGMAAMFYSRAAISIAQLFLVPTLALSWGLPLYGQWLMLTTIPTFVVMSDVGFGTTAGMRLIGEIARGEIDEAQLTYRAARMIVMLLSAAVLAGAVVVVALMPGSWLAVTGGMHAGEVRRVLVVLCLYGLLALQAQMFIAVGRATGRTAPMVAIESSVYLAEALAVAATALAKGSPFVAALSMLAVRSAGVAIEYGVSRRAAPWRNQRSARPIGQRIRAMWRPAAAASLIPLSQGLYLQVSVIAVGFAAGAAAVPIVTALRTLSRLGLQVTAIVAVPLMPEFAAAYGRADRRQASRIAGALATICIGIGAGYAVVVGFGGEALLALWTRGSVAAPQAMLVLTAIGLAASAVWNPLSDLLLAINRHARFALVYGAVAPVTVALTIPLVRALGVTGAAAANLLLEAVMAIVVLRALVATTGPLRIGPRVLASAVPARWRMERKSARNEPGM